MRTVADLIAERELAELEAEASALLVNLETTLARIREMKAEAGSNLRRRSR